MTRGVLTITPGRTLHDGARIMSEHNVGALVVLDPEQPGPGIISERDVIRSVSAGGDPQRELVQDHLTSKAVFASSEWPLTDAAQTMITDGFRHLVVIDAGQLEGIISMRDIVRVWRSHPWDLLTRERDAGVGVITRAGAAAGNRLRPVDRGRRFPSRPLAAPLGEIASRVDVRAAMPLDRHWLSRRPLIPSRR